MIDDDIYVYVMSADSFRMMEILSHRGEKNILLINAAKYRSMREACNWPVFMEVEYDQRLGGCKAEL